MFRGLRRIGQPVIFLPGQPAKLQELVQQRPDQLLRYIAAGESGPDHDKLFMSDVSLNGEVIGRGSGKTKKEAEQAAAREALRKLTK